MKRRLIYGALIALALVYVGGHIAALFTDAANWDEFALLRRAADTLLTGDLKGGGKPGLGVMPLLPFVHNCSHVMHVVHATRLLWSIATFALLAGLFTLLRIATRRSRSWEAPVIGTATLALVPIFMRWSLQVRTDQPAVACMLWAGVALMAKRPRGWVLAGVLGGTGYLFTQKAVYVLALVVAIALGDLYVEASVDWRREVRRVAAAASGAIAITGIYKVVIHLWFGAPNVMTLDQGMDLMRWYRYVLRFRLYHDVLPTLYAQAGLLVLVFAAAVRAFQRATPERKPLLVALVVVTLGVAIGRFHAASFPYFWITIGLFPATAIGIGWPGIKELLPRAHVWIAATAGIWMLALAVHYRAETLVDHQAIQRETLGFAEDLPADLRGFNTDGALFCRRDPDPLPVFLGQHISTRFGGADGSKNMAVFIAEHRTRPVAFLVTTPRVTFPTKILQFWGEHYVPYRANVQLAGRKIRGGAGTQLDLDIIVAGRYRWSTLYGAHLVVDGATLSAGDTIDLAVGHHVAQLAGPSGDGIFALAVAATPSPSTEPFYDALSLAELSGVRDQWW